MADTTAAPVTAARAGRRIAFARLRDLALIPAIIFIAVVGQLVSRVFLRGILTGVSGGQTFFRLPKSMLYLGTAQWLGMPASVWLCLLLFAAGIVVLGFTSFGRSLYAIGGNVDAAKAAGIRTDRVLW